MLSSWLLCLAYAANSLFIYTWDTTIWMLSCMISFSFALFSFFDLTPNILKPWNKLEKGLGQGSPVISAIDEATRIVL